PALGHAGRHFREAMVSAAPLQDDRAAVLTIAGGVALDVRLRTSRVPGTALAVVVVDDDTRMRELEKEREEGERQAVKDPLTGLYNRRFLQLRLPEELARAE